MEQVFFFLGFGGIAVCSEISDWEKVDVKITLKARSGAKQALCYRCLSWDMKDKKPSVLSFSEVLNRLQFASSSSSV